MREQWTDERLDDFRGEVNRRFDEVNQRIDGVNQRIDAGFVHSERRFERIEGRIDDLNRTLLRLGGGMLFALFGLIATEL